MRGRLRSYGDPPPPRQRVALTFLVVVAVVAMLKWGIEAEPIYVEPSAIGTATSSEAAAVLEQYLAAVQRGDEVAAAELFALEELYGLALGGEAIDQDMAPLEEALGAEAGRVVAEHVALVSGRTSLRVLGAPLWEEEGWAAIGVIHPSGAFDQWHMRVARVDGQLRIVDRWALASGEFESQVVRQQVLSTDTPRGRALRRIADQMSDPRAAVALIDSADEELRGSRDVQLMRVDAASKVGGATWIQAVEELLDRFPDDPAARLRAVQAVRVTLDHAESARHMEALNAELAPDSYLLVSAASAWMRVPDLGRARDAVDRAVAQDPRLLEGWVQLALVAAEQGDEAAVERALLTLEQDHAVTPEIVSASASEALKESESFKRWAEAG